MTIFRNYLFVKRSLIVLLPPVFSDNPNRDGRRIYVDPSAPVNLGIGCQDMNKWSRPQKLVAIKEFLVVWGGWG